ncbi:MAG: cupin domain-containing protein [Rhodobacteraceae bacterium]|nr:cupin domain-containing protein [Paracoccaceae bacterium]
MNIQNDPNPDYAATSADGEIKPKATCETSNRAQFGKDEACLSTSCLGSALPRGKEMKLGQAAVFAASVFIAGFIQSPASAENMVNPVLKTMLEEMPNTEANVVVFDVDPGWKTDHHIHPGQLFVYVMEGGLRLDVDGQEPVVYRAGEAFYEVPNLGMIGANVSATERAKFVVFQFGEPGKPLMVPQ